MFVEAIKKVSKYTRPIHTIIRYYGTEDVIPSAATLFFVNEMGDAITCKHVAEVILNTEVINARYKQFREERKKLPSTKKYNKRLKELEAKYSLKSGVVVQIKNIFVGCVDKWSGISIKLHPDKDIAIIKFRGFGRAIFQDHAVFLKDGSKVEQGRSLCRLGFPFPEFSNYKYNRDTDDIEWTNDGHKSTPSFPMDGIVTRQILSAGVISSIELSTPGLKGQSGGPLFDQDGFIYGMQSQTHHLHLGFDIKDVQIREGDKLHNISNHPFLHLGASVHLDIIKDFLKKEGIKYYESDGSSVGEDMSKVQDKSSITTPE
jgi:hypothetical protein